MMHCVNWRTVCSRPMYAAKGVGLAATQVDVHRRMIVLDVSETRDEPLVLINPELLSAEGSGPGEEGCLSLPGIYDKLSRATHIRVRALGRDGESFEMDAEGLLAVCIQHEMDHLEGKLFVDYLSELKRQLIRRRLQKERKQRTTGSELRASAPALRALSTEPPRLRLGFRRHAGVRCSGPRRPSTRAADLRRVHANRTGRRGAVSRCMRVPSKPAPPCSGSACINRPVSSRPRHWRFCAH